MQRSKHGTVSIIKTPVPQGSLLLPTTCTFSEVMAAYMYESYRLLTLALDTSKHDIQICHRNSTIYSQSSIFKHQNDELRSGTMIIRTLTNPYNFAHQKVHERPTSESQGPEILIVPIGAIGSTKPQRGVLTVKQMTVKSKRWIFPEMIKLPPKTIV